MPAGITVYNDANTVQIGDDYNNLCFISKVSGQSTFDAGSTESWGTRPHADVSFTVTGSNPPMVAVDTSQMHFLQLRSVVGNTYNYRICFGANVGAGPYAYTCYFFDKPPNSSPSTYGLQVFGADGSLRYDSLFRYARVVDFLRIAYNSGSELSYPVPAGRTYLMVHAQPGMVTANVPIPGGPNSYYNIVQIRGSYRQSADLKTAIYTVQTGPSSFLNPIVNYDARFLVLDVTGF